MFSFPKLEPVCCSMSGSNCCFLICIQISKEAGKIVWYSHLLKNFQQFVVIHTVKDFGIVNKAEVDVFFWNALAFSMIQQMLTISSLIPLPFINPALTSGSWWWTGRPGVLRFMRSQRVGHDWVTELNWTELEKSYLWLYEPLSAK